MPTLADEITEREHYFSTLPHVPVPKSFVHVPAADRPTPPDFPSDLSDDAIAEVVAWRNAGSNPASDSTDYPTDTDAVDYVESAVAYVAAIKAWRAADAEGRIAQHRWLRADAAIFNKFATSESSDPTGAGGDPPPAYLPPQPTHGNPP